MSSRDASEPPSRRFARHRERTTEARRWETMPVSQFPHELELVARGFAVTDTIHRLLLQWAQRDPDGFVSYVISHGRGVPIDLATSEYTITGELLDVLGPRDPAAAISVLKHCPDLEEVDLWLCAESWRNKSPDTFPQLLKELGDRLAADSPGRGWWARHDPISLLPLLQRLPSGPALHDLTADGVSYFLENKSADPALASAWWQQLAPEYQAVALDAFAKHDLNAVDSARVQAVAAAFGLKQARP